MTLTLEIPDAVACGLEQEGRTLSRTILEDFAVEAYRQGRLSTLQIRQMLGHSSRWESEEFLSAHNAWPAPSQDEVLTGAACSPAIASGVIVVSDTSPLCYLALLGAEEFLPRLFGQVICPLSVLNEGIHPGAPAAQRRMLQNPPAWLRVEPDPPLPEDLTSILDPGEVAAIALATVHRADLLLMDERKGRRAAVLRGLTVAGTLNIIAEAAARGWIDFDDMVKRLRGETNFRVSDAVVETVRQQALRY